MADAIIFRRRGGESAAEYTPPNITGGTQSNAGNWWTAIFTSNGYFKAGDAKGNQYTVLVFGGGGQGLNGMNACRGPNSMLGNYGGGGGNMNRSTLTLTKNTNITVTVGRGASGYQWSTDGYPDYIMGGTSSFGTYLSATGGHTSYPRSSPYLHGVGGGGGSGGGVWTAGSQVYSVTGGGGDANYPESQNINSIVYESWYPAAYGGSGGVWFGSGAYISSQNSYPHADTIPGGTYGGAGGIWASGTFNYVQTGWYRRVNTSNKNVTYLNNKKSTYGGNGSYKSSGSAGSTCSNAGWMYPNGVWMSGTSSGGSSGGGGGGYGSKGGSWGGGGGGWCANGGNYGGGGGGYGINGYGGDNGGGGGAYGRGGGPGAAPLYGGGGWGGNCGAGANGIVIIQWYSN